MREMTMEEVAQVGGGNWFLREVVRGIVVELAVDGLKAGGGAVWDYVKSAPPEVFQRERRAL